MPDLLLTHGGPSLVGRALLVVVLLAVSTAGWQVARRRSAVFHATPGPAAHPVLSGVVGAPAPGLRATVVQLSSPTCATCPQVRRLLLGLVADQPGVRFLELDVVEHLDVVRELDVRRTPTVLVLDARRGLRYRTSGTVRPDHARAALADVLTPGTRAGAAASPPAGLPLRPSRQELR